MSVLSKGKYLALSIIINADIDTSRDDYTIDFIWFFLLPFLFLSNIMCKCPRLFSMICCFLRNTHKKMSRLFSMICYFPRKKKEEKNSTTMIFSNRKTYLSNMCPTPCYMCELSIDRIWLWMRILWAYMIEQELV